MLDKIRGDHALATSRWAGVGTPLLGLALPACAQEGITFERNVPAVRFATPPVMDGAGPAHPGRRRRGEPPGADLHAGRVPAKRVEGGGVGHDPASPTVPV